MANLQENSQTQFRNTLFREIYKNTWLKLITPSNSHNSKKKEKWVVFCVHDDTDPYIETYVDNKIALLHKPDWYIPLTNIQYISPTICAHENDFEFVITLRTETIRLAAPTREQMLDWVESLKRKLSELRVLSPKENLYSKLPEGKSASLLSTRDPTSPLPPPPPEPPVVFVGVDSVSSIPLGNSPSCSRGVAQNIAQRLTYQRSLSDPCQNSEVHPTPPLPSELQRPQNVFTFENISSLLEPNPSEVSSHYEYLYQSQSQHTTPGPSTRQIDYNQPAAQRSTDCNVRILQPAPQPSKTLREQQVLQLQKEIKHPTGVRLQLRRKDCLNSIAFVDAFDCVWICGWKQKEHPMLHNALHIGDQIISIEGVKVKSAAEAHQVLQYCGLYVTIVIKRVPHGQVFIIHREMNGQPLGIIQENNTAVIETVESDSLAAKQGLTPRTRSCDGLAVTNWVLTEINGRPLNLFYKKNQVRDRLNSVGRDISILVQPLDLIKQLKKQLKAVKSYKDYLLD